MRESRVAVFVGRPAVADPAWQALAAACAHAGLPVRWQRPQFFDGTLPLTAQETCPLVVVPGGRAGAALAASVCSQAPTLVVENPPLRFLPAPAGDPWVGLFAAGVGVLHDAARLDPRRATALGLTVASRAAVDGPTLVLGQVPHDAAHGGDVMAYQQWLATVVSAAQAAGETVVLRPHPLAPDVRLPGVAVSDPTEPLADALARCGRVVTYSSSAQFEAAWQGVPVEAARPAGWTLAERLQGAAWHTWRASELATLDLVALATGQFDALDCSGVTPALAPITAPVAPATGRRKRAA